MDGSEYELFSTLAKRLTFCLTHTAQHRHMHTYVNVFVEFYDHVKTNGEQLFVWIPHILDSNSNVIFHMSEEIQSVQWYILCVSLLCSYHFIVSVTIAIAVALISYLCVRASVCVYPLCSNNIWVAFYSDRFLSLPLPLISLSLSFSSIHRQCLISGFLAKITL